MAADDLREPSLNDLCNLNVIGNITFAIRCARRMQPRFLLPASLADADKMKAIVDVSLLWAEEYVLRGTGAIERGTMLVEASSAVAEATYESTDYAAYAAYHAVRGALLAAQAPAIIPQDVFMEIVAAAFGSSRVLLSNVPSWLRTVAVKALRTDYEKLLSLHLESAAQRGAHMDATEAGPLGNLWQGQPPSW